MGRRICGSNVNTSYQWENLINQQKENRKSKAPEKNYLNFVFHGVKQQPATTENGDGGGDGVGLGS